MRLPVEWDDANVVDHLDENRHVTGRLQNLIVVVVAGGNHWRSCGRPQDASLGERPVLWAVGRALSPARGAGVREPLPLGCESGNFAVGWIDNQRCLPRPDDLCPTVVPELIVGKGDVRV